MAGLTWALAVAGPVVAAATQPGPINWGLDRIDQRLGGAANLDKLFRYSVDGRGVHVYIIDSGVRTTHREFSGRARFEKNFCPDAATPSGDDDSHGTHTASIAAGTLAGVAKRARIHSLRAFGPGCDRHTTAERVSYMTAALTWVTQHGQQPGVVNFSAGSFNDPTLQQKVLDVARAGFPIAVSAGCTADSRTVWGTAAERQSEGVFIAGSINRDDIAPSSIDYGPALTMFAPAVHLTAAMSTSDRAYGEYGDFAECADSFAAPHVAGVIATYLQRFRTATPARVYSDLITGPTDRQPAWVTGVVNRHTAPDRILQSRSW